jgi:hypothetical protein
MRTRKVRYIPVMFVFHSLKSKSSQQNRRSLLASCKCFQEHSSFLHFSVVINTYHRKSKIISVTGRGIP